MNADKAVGAVGCVTSSFALNTRCRRVPRLFTVASASLPLGTTSRLSSPVRMRVERMPTCSTVPLASPASIQSPRRNGRSATRMPAPNTLDSVSREAKATARPPMPRPATTPS